MPLVIGPTQAAARFTGVNGATRPAPIRAALTATQDRARLDIAAQPPAVEPLDVTLDAPAAAVDMDTAMV